MIYLIDNYDSFTFNLVHYLGELGAEVEVRRNDKVASSAVVDADPDAIVLCSSDAEYASLAPRVIQELRAAGRSTPVIAADNPAHSSNAVEVLRAWQERLGVTD